MKIRLSLRDVLIESRNVFFCHYLGRVSNKTKENVEEIAVCRV